MRTIETIKRDLKVSETDLNYHNEQASFYINRICELKAELKEAEDACKTKPKHGDIVIYGPLKVKRIIIKECDKFLSYDPGGIRFNDVERKYQDGTYTLVGNVFHED